MSAMRTHQKPESGDRKPERGEQEQEQEKEGKSLLGTGSYAEAEAELRFALERAERMCAAALALRNFDRPNDRPSMERLELIRLQVKAALVTVKYSH